MDRFRWSRASQSGARTTNAGTEAQDGFRLDAVPGVVGLDRGGPPEAALYEMLRLEDAVWRHGFVAYLRHRHETGLAGDEYLTEARLAAYVAVASDARVLRKTKAVLEASHRGRTLSLAELARAGDGPVEDRRKREVGLRERVLWPMDELGAWNVAEVPRAPRPAAHAPAGSGGAAKPVARGVLRYDIGAGPALVAFDALHYRPWFLCQLARLDVTFGRRWDWIDTGPGVVCSTRAGTRPAPVHAARVRVRPGRV